MLFFWQNAHVGVRFKKLGQPIYNFPRSVYGYAVLVASWQKKGYYFEPNRVY
jgi:hypothetical protein